MSYHTNKLIIKRLKNRKYSIGDIVTWTHWYPDEHYDPSIKEYSKEFIGVIIGVKDCDIPPDFRDVKTIFYYTRKWKRLTIFNQDAKIISLTEEYIKDVL